MPYLQFSEVLQHLTFPPARGDGVYSQGDLTGTYCTVLYTSHTDGGAVDRGTVTDGVQCRTFEAVRSIRALLHEA